MTQALFNAPLWARGPHAQTLLARALRLGRDLPMDRERIATPDGDFLDIDWGTDPGDTAPVALVIHGLEGSSRRAYVRNVCRELLHRGVRPVAMNLRGCSGEPNRLPRAYHSGESEDVTLVLELVRARHPGRAVAAWGFSLGGNILLKLLGEREDGGAGLVDAAVAMSVPYDLSEGCALLERTRMGRLYSDYFLRSLKTKIETKARILDGLLDLERAMASRSIREFDDHATAPLHGFVDAGEYYAACSSNGFLPTIRTPTLLLHSLDDPFLPATAVPLSRMDGNPALVPAITERGGHVGFVGGSPWHPVFWADEAGARFLASNLSA